MSDFDKKQLSTPKFCELVNGWIASLIVQLRIADNVSYSNKIMIKSTAVNLVSGSNVLFRSLKLPDWKRELETFELKLLHTHHRAHARGIETTGHDQEMKGLTMSKMTKKHPKF